MKMIIWFKHVNATLMKMNPLFVPRESAFASAGDSGGKAKQNYYHYYLDWFCSHLTNREQYVCLLLYLPTFYNNIHFSSTTINNFAVEELQVQQHRLVELLSCRIVDGAAVFWLPVLLFRQWVSLKNKILVNFNFNWPQTKVIFLSVNNWSLLICLYWTILHTIEFLYLISSKRNT